MEETFRDPNLLIDSIKGMISKQQERIKAIQVKLNEMNQIKEHLKASNKFIPNVSFDQKSFGQLYLNEYVDDQFKSKILTGQQPLELIKLCEFNLNDKFKLLYRGSRDGFGANHFHLKCDGKTDTLTIMKAEESSFIFGGFTSVTWGEPNHHFCQYKSDPNAFIFSLTNEIKFKLNQNQIQNAIYCNPGYGPTFGGGHDIFIASNANTTTTSSSNLGSTYSHPQYILSSNEAQLLLAGSYYFQLSEIEIYQKE